MVLGLCCLAATRRERQIVTHGQPLGVVLLGVGEQGAQRVVARNHKTGKVCEELATNVEDDQEEVESGNTDDGIGLGNTNLLLEVVKGGVFGELCTSYVSTEELELKGRPSHGGAADKPPCQ